MLPQMHLFSPEVQKFVLAAECLMFGDVTPRSLTEPDLKAIRYYVQCLIEKFETTPSARQTTINGAGSGRSVPTNETSHPCSSHSGG
jgi:hypothetical protein